MILRWCESPGNAARIAALSADQAPKPFVWKAESIRVHATIERRKQALESGAKLTYGFGEIRRLVSGLGMSPSRIVGCCRQSLPMPANWSPRFSIAASCSGSGCLY
jgi:hypothetical protein